MIVKLITFSIYFGLGLWFILSPLVARVLQSQAAISPVRRLTSYPYITGILLTGLFVWVSWIDAGGNHKLLVGWIIVSAVAALALWRKWTPVAIGSLMGMAIASAMPWWKHVPGYTEASHRDVVIYVLISLAALALLLRNFAPTAIGVTRLWRNFAIITFIPFALFLSFSTGISENLNSQLAWWHHWGAYIGPAELLLAGAHIFRDFPAQYGLGPTLTLAATCRDNCWIALYYIAGTGTFLLSFLVLCTALSFGIRSRLTLIVIPVVTIVACFFWTSFGPSFSSPLLYPSVAGLRFTPVAFLVAALCLIENSDRWRGRWWIVGHCLWALGALWSPEMFYAVSVVWWPYYCWRHVAGLAWKDIPRAFIKAAARLTGVLLLVLGSFLIVYGIAYHDLPSAKVWLAFMLYPPGYMPINPVGPVWWYAGVMIIGLATLFRSFRAKGDSPEFRRSFLVLLMGYAALSYCMGRSHDNNFLNLTPYAMLIVVSAFTSSLPFSFRAFSAAMLASIVGLMAVFGWSVWRDDYEAGRLFEFAPTKVINAFSYADPETAARVKSIFTVQSILVGDPADAAKAIAILTKRSGNQVTVIDHAFVMVTGAPGNVWDGFRAVAIYYYFPEGWRTKYLAATARRLNKDGWVIVEKASLEADKTWLNSYNAVYDLVGEEDFGTYHAYHYAPKSGG